MFQTTDLESEANETKAIRIPIAIAEGGNGNLG